MKRLLAALTLAAAPVFADGEPAGDFDYYVLALSWSPTWCALDGDDRQSPQCDDGRGLGFVLHGLWPQYERGWPAYCRTSVREATRGQTAAMSDIMGTAGSAWHQWKKHGRCSGLSASDYFDLARVAYDRVNRPSVLRDLGRAVTLPAAVVEEAFLEANPDLSRDQVTVTCRAGRVQEVRICLTRGLEPRRCGADVIRDCTMTDALLAPIR
ncbi:ribonuclease T(2) [Jannaschia pagri]|uniref:Ribonuclease T(2) n=1 Tax=Jannaschia pagri TaxID=2829797 RepID=A0ABQ4NIK0_9RHOB|nr:MULTISPECIES: ribonuclease T2 [unclassified Jannaschia]GIT89751.1 ribonuclease T(2) [Jannaschia sp. AI_61]GIT94141.1 ribonuclease T(2) [Jannaschia sp. AI_62]